MDETQKFKFGEYLQRKRKEKKYSIRNLALKSGVSSSYISMLERGIKKFPSAHILNKLSKPLGLEDHELLLLAGYIEKFEGESDSNENLFFFDLNDLSPSDIESVKEHIDYLRERAKSKKNNN